MADLDGRKKRLARKRRHRRVRRHIEGTASRPRLNIFRSNKNIFAQVIDDIDGKTIVSCSTIDKDVSAQLVDKTKVEASKIVGLELGKRAKEAGITSVVFDRGGFQYTGRVAAVAEGAREAGLEF